MSAIAILWEALGGRRDDFPSFEIVGEGNLPSAFAVSELAATSIGVAGCAVADLIAQRGGAATGVRVDRRLASMWFGVLVDAVSAIAGSTAVGFTTVDPAAFLFPNERR